MISAAFLALKITYLIKQVGKNRFTLSEAKLKQLAQKEVLSITYLYELKLNLEELGYFLGALKKGKYGLLSIESLEGAPSLPMKEEALKKLEDLSEEALEEQCISPSVETITDNVQDEEMLLLNELWLALVKLASESKTQSYGELAKSLETIFGYRVHHKRVMVLLESIMHFCVEYQIPLLHYLAVNGKSELPKTLENTFEAKNMLEIEKTKIYAFNWGEQKNNFDLFLNKNKEI